MTSIRLHFRPSVKSDTYEGKLFFRIIHARKTVNIPTSHKIFPHEWNRECNELIFSSANSARLTYLTGIQKEIDRDMQTLREAVTRLSAAGEYGVRKVADLFRTRSNAGTLLEYGSKVSEELIRCGQERTARAYLSAIKSLYRFTEEEDVYLDQIDTLLIKTFEIYLTENGLSRNTISFYMRNLRALYNRAIRENRIAPKERNPFEKVFTGISQSERRALSADELNSLARLDHKLSSRIEQLQESSDRHKKNRQVLLHFTKLRDGLYYFLFCYHARGMSFIDLAFLRKIDLQGSSIVYKRKKTGGCLRICITEPMKKIIDHFRDHTSGSKYLFPIIDPAKGNERKQYETALSYQNNLLSILSRQAGLERKVTTHYSRHTWATLAKHAHIPVAIISEALGHKDLTTTDRYLASFETSVLDRLSVKMSGIIQKKGERNGKKKIPSFASVDPQ